MAYSTVPRWDTGEEIEQGTSMAAPHAAGLAALLVSGAHRRSEPVDARAIKQALMVTARPLPGGTFVDEGTGIPESSRPISGSAAAAPCRTSTCAPWRSGVSAAVLHASWAPRSSR